MKLRRATLLMILGAASLSAWGCAAIIGADFDAHLAIEIASEAEAPDGDVMAPDVGPLVEAGCKHAYVPAKPTGAGAIGDIEFTVAIRSVDYGDGDDDAGKPRYRQLGYDLDRSCSADDVPGCLIASQAPPEGIDGRDNAAGGMIYGIKATAGFIAQSLGSTTDTDSIEKGAFTLMFHVTGYNGQADDAEVVVEWFVSGGFADGQDAGPEAGGGRSVPLWDGLDDWPLRKETVIELAGGGFTSSFITKNAYVKDDVLVANVGQGRILGGSVPFDLVQLIVTAKIAKEKGPTGGVSYVMKDGVIAGRWKADALLQAVPSFLVGGAVSPQLLCPGGVLYETVRGKVCNAQDISSGLDLGAATPCDALSVGIAFTSAAVLRPTRLVSVPPTNAGCSVPVKACDGQELVPDAGPDASDGSVPKDAAKDG